MNKAAAADGLELAPNDMFICLSLVGPPKDPSSDDPGGLNSTKPSASHFCFPFNSFTSCN